MRTTKYIKIPVRLVFVKDHVLDFEHALSMFDWDTKDCDVTIDFSECRVANYQLLSLVVLYVWVLRRNKCYIEFVGLKNYESVGKMWRLLNASNLFRVLTNKNVNFESDKFKPLFAIRESQDFEKALATAVDYTTQFGVEYEKTLRYVVSELLYNTMEHGRNISVPSLLQLAWYQNQNKIEFVIADVGIGIRSHLRQVYPQLETDSEAIEFALGPSISGTFNRSQPYQAKNNAGFGLYLSSEIVRRLQADMHIISGRGIVHISPADTTKREMQISWPGTIVHLTIQLSKNTDLRLDSMLAAFREEARKEIDIARQNEDVQRHYFSVRNYFGGTAEDKHKAIMIRDSELLPAMEAGKSIIMDFENVRTSPHSFLNALLSSLIYSAGIRAYKRIKIINATSEIRGTIDFIFDESTPNE